MTVSLFARKAVVSWGLILSTSFLGVAQEAYTKVGSEYSIGGSMPGAQTRAQASLDTTGGYLVWEDYGADGNDLGIMAMALDSHFAGKGAPFRVNQWRAGAQEKPQVSLTQSGGAVFAWLGGNQRLPHIYARYLNAGSTWAAGDQLVSSADHLQADPALAKLKDGRVVAVYSSYNQRGTSSMMDIYARVLAPAGETMPPEIPVNNSMTFAQRTPAVAALQDGGFVVVWVGEQQRSEDSIDIYGRLFDAEGTPKAPEFQINTGTNICANPAVAVAADGGFLVGWSELSSQRIEAWDVKVRRFDGAGVAGGESLANSYRRNNQMGPQIAVLGSQYFVAWTSMEQDRFNEGVYGRSFDANGAPVGGEVQVHTQVMRQQILPTVVSDGAERLLSVWSSFLGGIQNSFDLQAQKFALPGYAEPAVVASNFGAPSSDPYPMDPPPGTVDPVKNPWENWVAGLPKLPVPAGPATPGTTPGFGSAAGYYHGLFYEPNGVKLESAGYITAQTSSRQTYSARLVRGRAVYPISGKFDANGRATAVIKRAGAAPITVELQLDLAGGEQLHGTVTDGAMVSEILADKLVYNARTARPAQAGSYTLLLRSQGTSLGASPLGDGYALVKVDNGGFVRLSGKLADGTTISQRTGLSRGGAWPLYVPLYAGKGMVLSWIQFADKEDSDASGQVIWVKQAAAPGKNYAAGFTNEVLATVQQYTSPSRNQPVLAGAQGQVVLSGAGLSSAVTNDFRLTSGNLVKPSSAGLSMTVNASSGSFRGLAKDPGTGQRVSFQGVLDKKGGVGGGFFLKDNQSGHVFLGPLP